MFPLGSHGGGLPLFQPGVRHSAPALRREAAFLPTAAECIAGHKRPRRSPLPPETPALSPFPPPFPLPPATPAAHTRTTASHTTLSAARRSGTSHGGRGECVMALIDNRAAEVGVALCQLSSLTIIVTQYGDSVAFAKTLSFVFSRNPVEVLVPDTAVDRKLVQTLLRHFREEVTFTSVPRRSFKESLGAHRLMELMSTDEASLEVGNTDRYLCVAAANALIEFMEISYNYTLLPHAVRVRYLALENYVEISRLSARALHLIPSGPPTSICNASQIPQVQEIRHPQTLRLPDGGNMKDNNNTSNHNTGNRRSAHKTLFRGSREPPKPLLIPLVDALNHTTTNVGRRLLRSTLLQPLRDATSIELRYESVDWLRQHGEALVVLRRALRPLGNDDFERVISSFSHEPKVRTTKTMQQCMDAVVSLWMLLGAATKLCATLESLLHPHVGNVGEEEGDENEEQNESPMESIHVPRRTIQRKRRRSPESVNDGCSETGKRRATCGKHATLLGKLRETLTVCRMEDICTEMGKYLDEGVVRAAWQRVPSRQQEIPSQKSQQHRPHPQLDASRRPSCALLQVQQCFAVRPNLSGTLDAARHQYSQTVESIFSHAEDLRQRHGVGSLHVAYDTVRGYHLVYDARHERNASDDVFLHKYSGGSHYALYHSSCVAAAATVSGMEDNHTVESESMNGNEDDNRGGIFPFGAETPLAFNTTCPFTDAMDAQNEEVGAVTRHQVRGRRVTCTTTELLVLRRTADDAVTEILHTQDALVRSLVIYLRQRLGKLQAVCEAVAMLDLLVAFTTYARLNDCVRPTLLPNIYSSPAMRHNMNPSQTHNHNMEHGNTTTHFTEARHPGGLPTANTIAWSPDGPHVLLLTGPNASGKTTLLRQVGQLIALAQSGCPVPARAAALQPCDRLIAHMLCDDLDDANSSSFGKEMRELSYMCMHTTSESVVLMDELGRRTTPREGAALAWATVEFLVEVRCRAVCATHFGALTRLAARLPRGVRNVHLAVHTDLTHADGAGRRQTGRLRFEYKLLPGPCAVDHYGLRLAEHVGFFPPALALARELLPFMSGEADTAARISGSSAVSTIAPVSDGVSVDETAE